MKYPFPNRICGTSGGNQVNPIGGSMSNTGLGETTLSEYKSTLSSLQSTIDELGNRTQHLQERLSLVAKPNSPSSDCCEKAVTQSTPLLQDLDKCGDKVRSIKDMVNDIIDKLVI